MKNNLKSLLAMAVSTAITTHFQASEFSDKLSKVFVSESGGESTLDRPVGATRGGLELRANKDNSRASIRVGQSRSDPKSALGIASFSTYDLTASAPINKTEPTTALATLDGFANAFTLEFKFTQFSTPIRIPDLSDPRIAEFRRRIEIAAAGQGEDAQTAAANGVTIGNVSRFVPELMSQVVPLFWDPEMNQTAWGLSATVGHQEFKYLPLPTLSEATTDRIPYGAKIYWAVISTSTKSLWTFGAEYQRAFKDAKPKSVVAPIDPATGLQEVKTGADGPPENDHKELAFLEFRKSVSIAGIPAGVSMKATYDFKGKVFGVNVPILVARDDKGNLTGGLDFGWQDKNNKFTIGVIVGAAFSLRP